MKLYIYLKFELDEEVLLFIVQCTFILRKSSNTRRHAMLHLIFHAILDNEATEEERVLRAEHLRCKANYSHKTDIRIH